jgi:alkylhydroperoxidase family enzyme
MARVSYVEMEHANPEVREVYEQKLKGKPLNIQKALAHRPELLKNFLSFYGSVGRSLDRRLFELLYLRVAMINNCNY